MLNLLAFHQPECDEALRANRSAGAKTGASLGSTFYGSYFRNINGGGFNVYDKPGSFTTEQKDRENQLE